MANALRFMHLNGLNEFLDMMQTDSKLPVPWEKFILVSREIGIRGSANTRAADLGVGRELMVNDFFGRSCYIKKGIRETMTS